MELCNCWFVVINEKLDNSRCKIHTKEVYKCDECNCDDYKPASIKRGSTHWPICKCGHIAQSHN